MSIANSKWTRLLTGAAKFLPEAPWVAIVVELVSHLASSMGATSGDSKEALRHIEALRADLGGSLTQITAVHSGLADQLNVQAEALALHSEKLDALSGEVHLAQLAAMRIETRLTDIEARSTRTLSLALASCVLTGAAVVLLVFLLLHLR